MEISRNQEHYIIMTVIYDEIEDFTFGKKEIYRDARELTALLLEIEDFEQASDYIKNMIVSSLTNYGKIVDAFTPHLVNWTWERIPILTRSILVMSYAHYYYVEKITKKIVINTAVELTKKYVEEKQSKFVNAILEKVLQ